MTVSFEMPSDYEITRIESSKISIASSMNREYSIRKTFNFMAGKITTVFSDAIYQAAVYQNYGAAAGVAMNTVIESFADQPFQDEIELMHKKLTEMGGKPPALSHIAAQIIPGRKFG